MTDRHPRDTQVAIVGGGPAGLLLAHLLHARGIESVVLEAHERAHLEGRVRAGVLEHGTVEILAGLGLDARLRREGLVHRGIELAFAGARHRLDLADLTGGKAVTVYGQQEVVKDLIAARLAQAAPLLFEARCLAIEGIDGDRPLVRYRHDGREHELRCEVVAGCDGFHGIARASLPAGAIETFERVYPFAWLGILAAAPPASEELIYASHENGFALLSMRSPAITRAYVQCAPDEDLATWPDKRIWDELDTRLGGEGAPPLHRGPVLQKGVTAMRSFVAAPMRAGRLVLAGDAAHIVPPTGAKGLNLAASDIFFLSEGLIEHYRTGGEAGLLAYSEKALRRIWKAERFSWWMTGLLHRFPEMSAFDTRMQAAELDYLLGSEAAMTALAENYVGLPYA
jgi:p-hydroxybenzoate 3-monooxygenase